MVLGFVAFWLLQELFLATIRGKAAIYLKSTPKKVHLHTTAIVSPAPYSVSQKRRTKLQIFFSVLIKNLLIKKPGMQSFYASSVASR